MAAAAILPHHQSIIDGAVLLVIPEYGECSCQIADSQNGYHLDHNEADLTKLTMAEVTLPNL